MEKKKVQLFCIPFAGGSSHSFSELAGAIGDFVDVVCVAYPGRGKRAKEPFLTCYKDLLEDVKSQIVAGRDKKLPFALLGYSMGAAVAYDLMQYALEEKPVHVFLCAREAVDRHIDSQAFVMLGKEDFYLCIQKLGGIDSRIAANPRFLDIYMRPVYADYQLWSQYRYRTDEGMPDVDITAFYSENDTPREKVEGWKRLTTGDIDLYEYGDNHFFLFEHASEMGRIITMKLQEKVEIQNNGI